MSAHQATARNSRSSQNGRLRCFLGSGMGLIRVVCSRQAAAPKAVAAAEAGGASGLFNFLGGLVRGNASAAGAPGGGSEKKETMNSDALLHGAQNLLGNDTLSALGAAVFPFILARPGHV